MRRTIDISGFGGEYENACQVILDQGLAWLREHPDAHLLFKEFENIFGVIMDKSPDATALVKAATKDVPGGCTGAMVHCVVHHLLDIHKNGYDSWLSRTPKERIFTWDGTAESCPQTELSRKMEGRDGN